MNLVSLRNVVKFVRVDSYVIVSGRKVIVCWD
jgi:hypothetical protein